MTEPLRIDAMGADDRLLDALASRTYDGTDPIGALLLSFAQACDKPSPTIVPRRRHSGRRIVVSTFATTVFLASGASVAAAVTDHLPDGNGGWTSSVQRWWNALPGLSGGQGDVVVAAPERVTSSSSSTSARSPVANSAATQITLPSPTAAVVVVPAETLPGAASAAPSQTSPEVPASPTAAPTQLVTPSSSSPSSSPADNTGAPASAGPPSSKGGSTHGQNGSTHGQNVVPTGQPVVPEIPNAGRPATGRNVPAAMVEALDLAPATN